MVVTKKALACEQEINTKGVHRSIDGDFEFIDDALYNDLMNHRRQEQEAYSEQELERWN